MYQTMGKEYKEMAIILKLENRPGPSPLCGHMGRQSYDQGGMGCLC